MKEFEASFEYEETPDQMQAIEDVQDDMGKEKPMDRLVCGDVGFGKTEVALRAAFRAMMDGKAGGRSGADDGLGPAALPDLFPPFCPLSRSAWRCSAGSGRRPEQKKILEDLAKGKVDLVVGTHRLLQRDVVFKDLGLLIVDEEHRFGVSAQGKDSSACVPTWMCSP